MSPLISVIIPVHNAAAYVGQALESILAQDYRPLEILTIDDGSSDNSAEIIRRFAPVQYHWQANQGPGAARNHGVAVAQGALLAFLDADDLWTPTKLALQMEAFAKDPLLEAVFGHVVQFGPLQTAPAKPIPGPFPSTLLIKREAFIRVGGFETGTDTREAASWYLRALEANLRTHMLSEVVCRRRLHAHNRGRTGPNPGAYLAAIKASLDRRRQPLP